MSQLLDPLQPRFVFFRSNGISPATGTREFVGRGCDATTSNHVTRGRVSVAGVKTVHTERIVALGTEGAMLTGLRW